MNIHSLLVPLLIFYFIFKNQLAVLYVGKKNNPMDQLVII